MQSELDSKDNLQYYLWDLFPNRWWDFTVKTRIHPKAKVVDLFCGIGGMTHGFTLEGFDVVAGIDSDPHCRYGYERNNRTRFVSKDISDVTSSQLRRLFGDSAAIEVLVGCAPCQSFSGLNRRRKQRDKTVPLEKFARLIDGVRPHIVSMENVKGLANEEKFPVFGLFLDTLRKCGYHVYYEVIDCSNYGVPQRRKRLVLLASRLGPISLIPKTHDESSRMTVRQAIGHLPPIEDGEVCDTDVLHRAGKLSDLNKRRIKATPADGGNQTSWSDDLKLKCHLKTSGKSYRFSVYGRMRWDEPAPTMTTQCVGLGNGRFGHPEQDRAISLREAAILQTFPDDYEFLEPRLELRVRLVAKFIGNAVPVKLARAIARSISSHLEGLYG